MRTIGLLLSGYPASLRSHIPLGSVSHRCPYRNLPRLSAATFLAALLCSSAIAQADPVLVSMQPWGSTNDQEAMTAVFGATGWTLYDNYTDASTNFSAIFNDDTPFVYLQGSADSDDDLKAFLETHEAAILAWVNKGGSLLLESAGWSTSIDFGPARLVHSQSTPDPDDDSFLGQGKLTELGKQVFSLFPVETLERIGGFLAHDFVQMLTETPYFSFIEGVNGKGETLSAVGGIPYGKGYITMSGLTLYQFHQKVGGGPLGDDASSWLLNMIAAFWDAAKLGGLLSDTPAVDAANTLSSVVMATSDARQISDRMVSTLRSMQARTLVAGGTGKLALRAEAGALRGDAGDNRIGSFAVGVGVTDTLTFGAMLERGAPDQSLSGVTMDGQVLHGGLFLSSRPADGLGLSWKVTGGRAKGEVQIERSDLLAGTEAGVGTTDMTARLVQAELGYGIQSGKAIITPYARLGHARTLREGYTETDAVTQPITYDDFETWETTLGLGATIDLPVKDRVRLNLGAGLDRALSEDRGMLSGTSGIAGLEAFSVAAADAPNRLGTFASVGVTYTMSDSTLLSGRISATRDRNATKADVQATFGVEMRF